MKMETHGAYAYARSSPVPFRYIFICASLKEVTAFAPAARTATAATSERRIPKYTTSLDNEGGRMKIR